MQIIKKLTPASNGPAFNLVGNTTSAQIFQGTVNGVASGAAAVIPVPGSSILESLPFIVRASGWVIGGTTTNVTAILYAGNSLTPGSNTVLAQSTARAVNSTSAQWRIEAKLQLSNLNVATTFANNAPSNTPGTVEGCFEAEINKLLDSWATLTNPLTNINRDNEPVFNLCVGITFSASNANNLAGMPVFYLEA
jgi:hypothetical protein